MKGGELCKKLWEFDSGAGDILIADFALPAWKEYEHASLRGKR